MGRVICPRQIAMTMNLLHNPPQLDYIINAFGMLLDKHLIVLFDCFQEHI